MLLLPWRSNFDHKKIGTYTQIGGIGRKSAAKAHQPGATVGPRTTRTPQVNWGQTDRLDVWCRRHSFFRLQSHENDMPNLQNCGCYRCWHCWYRYCCPTVAQRAGGGCTRNYQLLLPHKEQSCSEPSSFQKRRLLCSQQTYLLVQWRIGVSAVRSGRTRSPKSIHTELYAYGTIYLCCGTYSLKSVTGESNRVDSKMHQPIPSPATKDFASPDGNLCIASASPKKHQPPPKPLFLP